LVRDGLREESGAAAAKTDAGPGDSPAPAATETKAADEKKTTSPSESKPAQDGK